MRTMRARRKIADFVALDIEMIEGVQTIMGAYLNVVAYDLKEGQPEPPKFWLLQGRWPVAASEQVFRLVRRQLRPPRRRRGPQGRGQNRQAICPYDQQVALRTLLKMHMRSLEVELSEQCSKRSARTRSLSVPGGLVSLRELSEFLREGWKRAADDQEVEQRVEAFWKQLAVSIEDGIFDSPDAQIVRFEERPVPITSTWLRGIQEVAEGVFDEPSAIGRYLVEAQVPVDAIKNWVRRKNYHVPDDWFPTSLPDDAYNKDLIKAAVSALGPRKGDRKHPDYMKAEAYYQSIVEMVRKEHGVDVGESHVKQIVLAENRKGQKDNPPLSSFVPNRG